MKPKILVSVPNGNAWIHKHVALYLMRLMRKPEFNVTVILPTNSPYVHNLHKIRQDFLKGEYTHWLTLDADNPPRYGVEPLEDVYDDFDVIGFPTPVWHNDANHPGDYPIYWNAMQEELSESGEFLGWKPYVVMEGIQRVDAVGSGCLLIARRVMEKINAPFMRHWDEDGIVEFGGDFMFCRRCKEHGFKVWADFSRPCFHFNTSIEIAEIGRAFENLKPKEFSNAVG